MSLYTLALKEALFFIHFTNINYIKTPWTTFLQGRSVTKNETQIERFLILKAFVGCNLP